MNCAHLYATQSAHGSRNTSSYNTPCTRQRPISVHIRSEHIDQFVKPPNASSYFPPTQRGANPRGANPPGVLGSAAECNASGLPIPPPATGYTATTMPWPQCRRPKSWDYKAQARVWEAHPQGRRFCQARHTDQHASPSWRTSSVFPTAATHLRSMLLLLAQPQLHVDVHRAPLLLLLR